MPVHRDPNALLHTTDAFPSFKSRVGLLHVDTDFAPGKVFVLGPLFAMDDEAFDWDSLILENLELIEHIWPDHTIMMYGWAPDEDQHPNSLDFLEERCIHVLEMSPTSHVMAIVKMFAGINV